MKGIILAGGSGTRLYPITKGVSKQLLNIYDKPMIYYPLSTLMIAGIKDILIISTPVDLPSYKKLLGNGNDLGIRIEFEIQESPDGLAQAFIIGEKFIGKSNVCLILGDNLFYGNSFKEILKSSYENVENNNIPTIFGYYVKDPERYGVVEFDSNKKAISIEEKPLKPKSNYAIVGLYFYPNSVVDIAKRIKPSKRGELEISTINEIYMKKNLNVKILDRGFAWLDTGTHDSLLEASNFIHSIQKRQGLKVSCIEEIAFENGFISKNQLFKLATVMKKNEYGKYLLEKIKDEKN
ncbi:glucose-1-phosphate thymidylyltransferase RfbA [Flavobacteriaceae bacterium]|jgi:glucose-1-phosphate thymidylyltransferase|nr:glucose-1-phosphate thymidylyltransferase RfbA [Flavobacteriaceae bacterium]